MNAISHPFGGVETSSARSAAEIARSYQKDGLDWTTLLWTACGFAAIAASSWAAWTGRWPLWAGFLTNMYFMFFIFGSQHEAAHNNIAHGRLAWINPVLGWLCGFVNLVPFRGWGDLHVLHHVHVNDPILDPDGWMNGKNPFNVIFRCMTIPPHYVYYYLSTKAYDKVRGGRISFVTLIANWVIALGASGWMAAHGDLRLLILWPISGYMCIFLSGIFFVWFPHYPREGRTRTDNATTYIFKGPAAWLMRVFDFWQSFHIIHHAYPRVPFYRHGKLFHELRGHIEADGSEIIEVR